MIKMSDAHIAHLAKQAPDIFCLFAMIDVKCRSSFRTRIGSLANSAFAPLFCVHAIVRPVWQAETPLQMVVSFLLWVSLIPFTVVLRMLFWVLLLPVAYCLHVALLAARLKAVMLRFRFIEFCSRKHLFTDRTVLVRRRVTCEFGHGWSFYPINHLNRIVGLAQ